MRPVKAKNFRADVAAKGRRRQLGGESCGQEGGASGGLGPRSRPAPPRLACVGLAANLFEAYFRLYKPRLGSALPALTPQVYLHYESHFAEELDSIFGPRA